jgi:hypothetical protein
VQTYHSKNCQEERFSRHLKFSLLLRHQTPCPNLQSVPAKFHTLHLDRPKLDFKGSVSKMFHRIRRRPRAFVERTSNGRPQIVLERRHSHSGYRQPEITHDSSDEDRRRDPDRRLLGENYALREENQRLLADNQRMHADSQRLFRDNQALTRHTNELRNERDYLAQENQERNAQDEEVRDLQRRLARERRRVRDGRAARETADRQRAERLAEMTTELTRLRDAERRWRDAVMALTREVEDWVRVNREKESRIREMEELLRRFRIGGLR